MPRFLRSALVLFLAFLSACGGPAERREWATVTEVNTIEAYTTYIETEPYHTYVTRARHRIDQLRYEEAISTDSVDSYIDFLNNHPNTSFRDEIFEVAFRNAAAEGLGSPYWEIFTSFPGETSRFKIDRNLPDEDEVRLLSEVDCITLSVVVLPGDTNLRRLDIGGVIDMVDIDEVSKGFHFKRVKNLSRACQDGLGAIIDITIKGTAEAVYYYGVDEPLYGQAVMEGGIGFKLHGIRVKFGSGFESYYTQQSINSLSVNSYKNKKSAPFLLALHSDLRGSLSDELGNILSYILYKRNNDDIVEIRYFIMSG